VIWASALLLVASAIGLTLHLLQLVALRRHLAGPARVPRRRPPISIMKPLCGLDDDLEDNLEQFATLDYPRYELLLGVKTARDPAYPVARAVAMRHPGRVRVVVQRGEPGLNPKVNQLITLARAARFDLLVVSDSNVSVDTDYLDEIAAQLADPSVGLVTHAVVGIGERRLGALLDNLHLGASIGAGMIGAKRVARKDLVVGKSMALRRGVLRALGGFESVGDVLAEDYVLGRRVGGCLGLTVVMARRPVRNVTRGRSVGEFLARYNRWSVLHRKALGPFIYTSGLLLNPLALAAGGAALSPSLGSLEALLACAFAKAAYDASALRALRGGSITLAQLIASPLKDLLLASAWLHGMMRSTVKWRGNRLRVLAGTYLARPQVARHLDPQPVAQPALDRLDAA